MGNFSFLSFLIFGFSGDLHMLWNKIVGQHFHQKNLDGKLLMEDKKKNNNVVMGSGEN